MNYKERQSSYFYNMRKFHNFIKKTIYKSYATNKSILELAVGKAGDLHKWKQCNVSKVIGYDISKESIEEGLRRLSESEKEFSKKVTLEVKDLRKDIIVLPEKVDVVACMFAFHYFIKDINIIIQSIKNNLKEGGYFIGCCFDGTRVLDRLKTDFNDSNFQIKQISSDSINVLLKQTVLDTPEIEFLVDFKELKIKMKNEGFKLVKLTNFENLYNTSFNLSKTEMDVSFLNTFFVFQFKG